MVSPTSPREGLFACLPPTLWNPPSFTVASTPSSSCSHSYYPFSHQSAALTHLDSLPLHNLVIWTNGSVPFFGNNGFSVLANSPLLITKSTLFFSQYVQVFALHPAPFCKLFAGLGSTNKSAISLLFSFSPTLTSHPSFFLPQTFWLIWQELSTLFFYYEATMGPMTLISTRKRRS